MGMISVGKENSTSIDLYYEDHGAGTPVVLIHGWPLSGASWEKQTAALLKAGHRVITYDRRGFGRSSKPTIGYNYDTFAADLDALLKTLDNYDVTGGTLVSDRVLEDNWNVAAGASPTGTLQCVDSWLEDFRKDVAKNTVPTLIIHGDADRILPPAATARRQAKLTKDAKLVELPGGPHGLCWTHGDHVNAELLPFVE
jgi:pimeloyl-ACP methyl ester carboxylesterase